MEQKCKVEVVGASSCLSIASEQRFCTRQVSEGPSEPSSGSGASGWQVSGLASFPSCCQVLRSSCSLQRATSDECSRPWTGLCPCPDPSRHFRQACLCPAELSASEAKAQAWPEKGASVIIPAPRMCFLVILGQIY